MNTNKIIVLSGIVTMLLFTCSAKEAPQPDSKDDAGAAIYSNENDSNNGQMPHSFE